MQRWHGSMLFRMQREKRVAPNISKKRGYSGRFIIRNTGYIVNPDLLNFVWSGDVGLYLQQFLTQDIRRNTKGRLLGHHITASLFQSNPKSLIFLWNQNTNVINIDENGRTGYDTNTLQASLHLRDSWLSSRLHLTWHDLWEEWSRVGFKTTRNQLRRSIRYVGKREEDNSLYDVNYDFNSIQDRIRSKSSYSKHTANIRYRHAFGEEQANQLDSKFNLFLLSGFSNHKSARLKQSLKFQHPYSLASQYHHTLALSHSTVTGTALQNTAYAAILHSLYGSLNSNFGVGGSFFKMRDGKTFNYSASGGFSYSKKIPLSGRIMLGYTRGFSINDNKLESTEKVIVSERHVFIGGFPVMLNERNIILSTILVFDNDGQLMFEEGEDKDYVLRVIGERVEIYRNVFGRITEGEVVVVDYHFQTIPAMRYSTNSTVFNAGLNFGWLSMNYSENRHDQNLLEGDLENISSLQNLFTKAAQLKINLRGEYAGTTLMVEHRIYQSRTLDYKAVDVRYSFFISPFRSLTLSNNFGISFLNHYKQRLINKVYFFRSELNWRPSRTFILQVYGNYRLRRETIQPDETNFEYGGTLQRTWRIFRALFRYEKRNWDFEPKFINERRFTIEVERLF